MAQCGGMSILKTKDGAEIYYKDWGAGRPIVFSHGWPLSADAWDAQMMFFGSRGYRVIAHDRRGHGRSSQTWTGNEMDTYASDVNQLFEHLDLRDAVMVGHSTGGGEVAHYLGQYGTKRVAKAVLIGAVTPVMGITPENPNGVPQGVFDGLRAAVLGNRAQFYRDFPPAFFGFNRPGAQASQGLLDTFWMLGMQGSVKAAYDCIAAFSETDFTEDLKKIDIPLLIQHGDDDQIVPYATTAVRVHEMVRGSTLKLYPGYSHAMATVNAEVINADILAFIEGK